MGFNYRAITGSTKISNNTDAFAVMAGTRNGLVIGQRNSVRSAMRRAQAGGSKSFPCIPPAFSKPSEQLSCMQSNKLRSVNPVGSGGVGKMNLIFSR